LDSKDFHFNVGWITKFMPMWSSISMVASCLWPYWAPHSKHKINTPSLEVSTTFMWRANWTTLVLMTLKL
jgi:hypothetical protein